MLRIRVIKEMYDGATTTIRCAAGLAEEFEEGNRLHQGSALNPFFLLLLWTRAGTRTEPTETRRDFKVTRHETS